MSLKLLSLSSLHLAGTALRVIREISYNLSIGVLNDEVKEEEELYSFLEFLLSNIEEAKAVAKLEIRA